MSRMAEQQLYIHGGYVPCHQRENLRDPQPCQRGSTGDSPKPRVATMSTGGKERPTRAKNLGGDERHGTFAYPAQSGGYSARA